MPSNPEQKDCRPIELLLVEDSPSDVFLTKRAIKASGREIHLSVVSDGVEAMAFLKRQGKYADAPMPHLILLDLNMPRKDGRELLSEIKTDHHLKCTPVIVLTSSSAQQDVSQAYELHANCYVVKPATFDEFKEIIERIELFWFNTAILPPYEKC